MTEQRTILVTGATGNVGRHVVAGLLEGGATVRALVRTPALAGLPDGVEVVPGDLTDPDSVAGAAEGADAAFLLWPFFTADGAEKAIGELARRVSHLVYLSAASVRDDQGTAQSGVWGQVEQLIKQTGLDWTFLRAGGFASNTLEWAEQIRAGDVVRLPYPDAGRSLIHERDIAAVAVRALLDRLTGQKYELTGPETQTQAEQIRQIGEAIGRPLRAEALAPEVARDQLLAQWGDESFVDNAMAYWASLVDEPEQVLSGVPEVLGRPALTFSQWAHHHADDFR
jgi:uncharacterized protein YbjT (DUF2867 family)